MPTAQTDYAVRCAGNQILEAAPRPHASIYRQHPDHISVQNDTLQTLVPGEPVPFGDTVGVFKGLVCAGEVATLRRSYNCDFRLAPDEATETKQGAEIYWDYDKSFTVNGVAVVGWATKTKPTNGVWLGYAAIPHDPGPLHAKPKQGSNVAAPAPANVPSYTVRVTKYGGTPSAKWGTIGFEADSPAEGTLDTLPAGTP